MSLAGAAYFKTFSSLALSSDQDLLMDIAQEVRDATDRVSQIGEALTNAETAQSEIRSMFPMYQSRIRGLQEQRAQISSGQPTAQTHVTEGDIIQRIQHATQRAHEMVARALRLGARVNHLRSEKQAAKHDEEQLLAEKNRLETKVKLDEQNIKMAKQFEKMAVKQFAYS